MKLLIGSCVLRTSDVTEQQLILAMFVQASQVAFWMQPLGTLSSILAEPAEQVDPLQQVSVGELVAVTTKTPLAKIGQLTILRAWLTR